MRKHDYWEYGGELEKARRQRDDEARRANTWRAVAIGSLTANAIIILIVLAVAFI